ncbi:hypothetical protein DFJ74DRAFT_379553 [Hyaloraphidium curvatum]|nr:hypothetical protein DFJ74DRAFT_379553 [Hyaloraphidium curvatum]
MLVDVMLPTTGGRAYGRADRVRSGGAPIAAAPPALLPLFAANGQPAYVHADAGREHRARAGAAGRDPAAARRGAAAARLGRRRTARRRRVGRLLGGGAGAARRRRRARNHGADAARVAAAEERAAARAGARAVVPALALRRAHRPLPGLPAPLESRAGRRVRRLGTPAARAGVVLRAAAGLARRGAPARRPLARVAGVAAAGPSEGEGGRGRGGQGLAACWRVGNAGSRGWPGPGVDDAAGRTGGRGRLGRRDVGARGGAGERLPAPGARSRPLTTWMGSAMVDSGLKKLDNLWR